jgi:putative membrane protein insertion efficiency factor
MKISALPRRTAIALINVYQKIFSFDHGPLKVFYPYGFCRFNPTCSEYSRQAIEKYGVIRGGVKGAWRVLRCNPFNEGGNDPLV